MTKVRVATWNAEGMFVEGTQTRRAKPHDALKALSALNADVVVIPEFGDLTRLQETTITALHSLGYEAIINPYNDPRAPGLGFGLLSRLPVHKHRTVKLSVTDRTILEVYCEAEKGKLLRIIGVHLDDREEAIRMKQVRRVAEVVNADTLTSTVLMGDFNAMPATSRFAKLTRTKAAGAIARRIPVAQVSSVARRVHEMAIGTTIQYLLEHTRLNNLDPTLSPTVSAKQRGMEWAPSLRLAKIDWIFGSPHIQAKAHVIKKDVGSDHRQVVADIVY